MRILSCVGTRPEIIKNLALARAAARLPDLELLIAHSGQNFGPVMADGFVTELGLPLARQNERPIDRSSAGSTAHAIMDFVAESIRRYAPAVVISNTDTDTAFYTALTAARMQVPVAHIEGGIRCEARSNPEEINRRLADHLSSWVFTISDEDTQSLLAEGYPRDSVFMAGDVTLDALQIVCKEHHIRPEPGNYDVLTIHRQENTGRPDRLAAILDAVEDVGNPTIFPVHPRTRQSLESAGLLERLRRSTVIEIREPQGYVAMLALTAGCRKVISDSGGLRREAYMLGKPVISLVSFVWFRQMNALGFELCVDADGNKLRSAIRNFAPPDPRPPLFGDGRAAERILSTLQARVSGAVS